MDPSEKYNVADEHPVVISEIMDLVEKHQQNLVRGEDQLAPVRDDVPVPWQE